MSSCVGSMGTWEPGIQFSSRVRSAGHWAAGAGVIANFMTRVNSMKLPERVGSIVYSSSCGVSCFITPLISPRKIYMHNIKPTKSPFILVMNRYNLALKLYADIFPKVMTRS